MDLSTITNVNQVNNLGDLWDLNDNRLPNILERDYNFTRFAVYGIEGSVWICDDCEEVGHPDDGCYNCDFWE